MTECNGQIALFSIGRRKVTVESNGTFITSNAGVLLASRIEHRLGLARRLSGVLTDDRDPSYVVHSYESQVRQRLLQIVCGYEDCNDATTLRHEPAFQTAMGRVAGTEGAALASQPTLSRFEQRSRADVLRASEELLDVWTERCIRNQRRTGNGIVLDFDGTDAQTHGAQQLSMFHGYYDHYMYHPLLVFDGQGWPVAMVLRPGRAHASTAATSVLLRIYDRIAHRLSNKTSVSLRADAGFAVPEMYDLCETLDIRYTIGQNSHATYKQQAEELLSEARRLYQETGQKVRLFTEFRYQAQTWSRERRVICKVEIMPEGENVRFVLTNIEDLTPEEVYDFYTGRGQSENHIKDLKNAMFGDRMSCSSFYANQFRLLLHAAAYMIAFELRGELADTALAAAQMDTLRLKLLKIGACIIVTARRIWVRLSEFDPSTALFERVSRRLIAAPT